MNKDQAKSDAAATTGKAFGNKSLERRGKIAKGADKPRKPQGKGKEAAKKGR